MEKIEVFLLAISTELLFIIIFLGCSLVEFARIKESLNRIEYYVFNIDRIKSKQEGGD